MTGTMCPSGSAAGMLLRPSARFTPRLAFKHASGPAGRAAMGLPAPCLGHRQGRAREQRRSLPEGRGGSPARSRSPSDGLAGDWRHGSPSSSSHVPGQPAAGGRPRAGVPHALTFISAPVSGDGDGSSGASAQHSSDAWTEEEVNALKRRLSSMGASTSTASGDGEGESSSTTTPLNVAQLEAMLALPAVDPRQQVSHDQQHQEGGLPPTLPDAAAASAASQQQPASPPAEQQHGGLISGIPAPILLISVISGSLTMASCVFNTLLPIYMVTELKMTMRSMGMFEGILEAFSYVVRMFSGVVSDMMTSRKAAITLGFAMGAAAKFGMASSAGVTQLFASKAMDRLANGVQAAPRDALISDLAPPETRSSCFGFAQSLRKWGSMVGALLSYFLMRASNNNYQAIFFLAAGVSMVSCLAFVLFVPSHARPQQQQQQPAAAAAAAAQPASGAAQQQPADATKEQQQKGFSLKKFGKDVMSMGPDFYRMLLIVCLYGMGHINESLLEARAIEVGFGKAESTLVVAALAATIFLSALPLGRLDDARGPRTTFAVGMAALALGNLTLLAATTHPWAVFAATAFLGVHWAVIQGPMLSIVVGLAPANLRGTAFGIFYTVMAFTAVGANTLFGSVWTAMGANAAFSLSASMMGCTLLALPLLLPKGSPAAMSGSARARLQAAAAKAQEQAAAVAQAASAAVSGGKLPPAASAAAA